MRKRGREVGRWREEGKREVRRGREGTETQAQPPSSVISMEVCGTCSHTEAYTDPGCRLLFKS